MNNIIDINELLRIFPKKSEERDENKRKTHTEWCVTKYKIENRNFATISYKIPESEQTFFIDETGERIIYDIDSDYDEFIVERKFWYSQ